MGLYRYKAMDQLGHLRRGCIAASNLDDLEARIHRMGLDLIAFKTATPRALRSRRGKARRRDLIHFCFHLEQLTGSGVPLLQALTDVRDTLVDSHFRQIVSGLIESVVEGKSLSTAMKEFPHIFDTVFVNLVRVGEESGELPAILADLTATLKWNDELIARATKVLLYPAIVGASLLATVAFLMAYVIPQLAGFIASAEIELPVHTRALLALSSLVVDYGLLIAMFPPLAIAVLIGVARHDRKLQLRLDALWFRLWLFGDILHKLVMARFLRTIALMYRAGIPLLDILRLARMFVGNRAVEQAIDLAARRIGQGESVSSAFGQDALFPPLVLRMISVGEKTGALDRALLNVSYFFDREAKERIDRLEAVMGPMMTLLLGAVLGWIMLAVLDPVYELVSRISG